MDSLKVITNNVPRPLIDAYELNEKEREQFDYLDWDDIDEGKDSATFFRYKGELYSLDQFMRVAGGLSFGAMGNWHGYMSDSFFSGTLMRYAQDTEYVVVGRYNG